MNTCRNKPQKLRLIRDANLVVTGPPVPLFNMKNYTVKFRKQNIDKGDSINLLQEYRRIMIDYLYVISEQLVLIDEYIEKESVISFSEITNMLREELIYYFTKYMNIEEDKKVSILREVELMDCKYYNTEKKINHYSFEKGFSKEKGRKDTEKWFQFVQQYKEINKQEELWREMLFYQITKKQTINHMNYYTEKGNLHFNSFRGYLSETIKNQRKELNLTQTQLAKRCNVDRTMIAKIESVQQNATMETAVKLLSALELGLCIIPLKDNSDILSLNSGNEE